MEDTCSRCDGSGEEEEFLNVQCPDCNGTGVMPNEGSVS